MSCYYPRILCSLCPIVQGFSDMYITHVFFRIAGLVVVCPYILLIGIMDSMDAKKNSSWHFPTMRLDENHWKSKRLIITIRTLLLAANQSCCKAIWHNLTRREPTRWGNQDLDMWVQKKVTVENRDICCERTTFWRELTVKTVKTKIDIFVTMSAMGSQASDREKPWFWRERTTFWRERTVKTVKTQIDMFVTISALSWLESDSLQVHLIIARFWFTKRWFLIFGGAMALPNLPFPVAEFGWDKLDHSSSSWPGWMHHGNETCVCGDPPPGFDTRSW